MGFGTRRFWLDLFRNERGAFTILDNDESITPNPQSIWMQTDIDALVQGLNGEGVLVGCDVTAQATPDMTVAVAAGLVKLGGKSLVVVAGNVTVSTADVTNPRLDLIRVDNTGAKGITAGTAAANPKAPALPANNVLLAMVLVPTGDTTLESDKITDKRVIVQPQILKSKPADESVTSSVTLQNDDNLFFDADANSIWLVELALLANGATAGDFKCSWTVPTSATMQWGPDLRTLFDATANLIGIGTDYWVPKDVGNDPTGLLPAAATFACGMPGAATVVGIVIRAIVFIAGTAGTVTFQWAQNTSNATATKVLKGSAMRATRVG